MKRKPIKHSTDGLAALLLFGVFAVCVLAVLLTGANAYRRLTDRDQAAYQRRTCVQYLATRVRQADSTGAVKVSSFNGIDALTLAEGAGEYATRIYCYDGWLMELYSETALDFDPEAGERVLACQSAAFSLEDGLLVITVDSNGTADTLRLFLHSGEEGRR